ncbi:argininosuccinate synthase [Anthocerotibacter panamensis]|uniref:argininosuccinate synthase n=1 Tax=Anthocerotibacter panamensis TaxID=2857077 RepID=UPI001C402013|nr:argininosuccinate synthase [Anthocerotibacter panamensis]
MRAKRVVLAYSGGVDTSVCIPYLRHEWGAQAVVALSIDLGQKEDMEQVRLKALNSGASEAHVYNGQDVFVSDYIWPALAANAMYEGQYPLATALARPLIARLLVEVAEATGADAVAHGCTGKGNDQVRFDVSIKALNPTLKVLAPAREWGMSREETIAYGERYGIASPVKKKSPYSIDFNLYGRSIECGILEDPWAEPPEEIYGMTCAPADCPAEPAYVTVGFTCGLPTALDGVALTPVALIEQLNVLAGAHGIGRIDMVENRLVGIKSREIYECPAAVVLIAAHRALEAMTLPREVTHYKQQHVEPTYAQLIYNGLWYSPLRTAMDGFIAPTQASVTGEVRLRLLRGQCTVVGRRAPQSLYDDHLATYSATDSFDHRAAEGFIYVWGLPTKVWSEVHRR